MSQLWPYWRKRCLLLWGQRRLLLYWLGWDRSLSEASFCILMWNSTARKGPIIVRKAFDLSASHLSSAVSSCRYTLSVYGIMHTSNLNGIISTNMCSHPFKCTMQSLMLCFSKKHTFNFTVRIPWDLRKFWIGGSPITILNWMICHHKPMYPLPTKNDSSLTYNLIYG